MLRCLPVALAVLVALPCAADDKGKLSRMGDEARTNDGKPGTRGNGTGGDDDDGDDAPAGGFLGSIFGLVLAYSILSPFLAPHLALERDAPAEARFPGYPYEGDAEGHLVFVNPASLPCPPAARSVPGVPGDVPLEKDDIVFAPRNAAPEVAGLERFGARFSGEYGYDPDGVHRGTLGMSADTSSGFGFDTTWTYLSERLEDDRRDTLVMGVANVTYRFAEHEHAEFHAGLGGRVMLDTIGPVPGFSFTYSIDVFPVWPVIVSTGVDLGTVGWAFYWHPRGSVGVTAWGFELYVGYDAIGVNEVVVHGPMAGIRRWF
jgi:hypothetical protein